MGSKIVCTIAIAVNYSECDAGMGRIFFSTLDAFNDFRRRKKHGKKSVRGGETEAECIFDIIILPFSLYLLCN